MRLPDYKLVGSPGRFQNGHGKLAKYYAQRFRLHERSTTQSAQRVAGDDR